MECLSSRALAAASPPRAPSRAAPLQKYATEELTLDQYKQLIEGEKWGNFTGVLNAWGISAVRTLSPPDIPALTDLLDALRELRAVVRGGAGVGPTLLGVWGLTEH
jgi:hypothetical protein